MAADALEPLVPLATQLVDLRVQRSDHVHRLVDRRSELIGLSLPSGYPLDLRRSASHLGVDLLAQLALLSHRDSCHDKLHAAGFANSVLAVAVLTEVAPLPIAADETVLIEEAHCEELGDAFVKDGNWFR